MPTTPTTSPPPSAGPRWTTGQGRAPGLAGLAGRVRLHVDDEPAGVLLVDDSGDVWVAHDGEAGCMIFTDTHETLEELLRGDLPPMVAHLQGRLKFEGDVAHAIRVLFGLQAGSPWAKAKH
jgi:hypothetical protein